MMAKPERESEKVIKKPELAKNAKKLKSEQQVIWALQAVMRSKKFNQEASEFRVKARRRINSLSLPDGAKYMAEIMTDNPVSRRWQVPPQLVMVDEGTLGDPSRWHLWGWQPWQDYVRDAVAGYFVSVTLPLTLPRETVLQHISDIYDFYSLPTKETKRKKTLTADPWEVWDRHEKEEKHSSKLLKIFIKSQAIQVIVNPSRMPKKKLSVLIKKQKPPSIRLKKTPDINPLLSTINFPVPTNLT
jgi:hypothetical protein